MLRIDDLTAAYGGIVALAGVSLEVRQGQTVALIGSNGAGKSTLLNTIVGALHPSRGTIAFDDCALVGMRTYQIARRGLVLVPEGRQILAPLTVRDNLELGRLALGRRKSAFDIPAIFRLFPKLQERQAQIAGSLSGGEQQMLAIGRALMGGPQILLLDEPSLGLSPVMASLVFATLKSLNDSGMTILLVEQNARRALEIADVGYVLERGKVVAHGPSKQLASDPQIISHYLGAAA
jgi:branched-chain amino acid transport system ATP-binding protein